MDFAVYAVAAAVLFVGIVLGGWMRSRGRLSKMDLRMAGRRVLFVTAHPDDECMFFAPTILALTCSSDYSVHLLCLSEGGYYGQASVRKEEIRNSAGILGIPNNHVSLVTDKNLPDSPEVEWAWNSVQSHVLNAIKENGITTVVTFDEYGVSGHANHISTSLALQELHHRGKLQEAGVQELYLLESVGFLRKYTGWLSHYCEWNEPSTQKSRPCAVSSFDQYLKSREAMAQHRSQYLWFRRLYFLFSRYLFVNTFQRLAHNQ